LEIEIKQLAAQELVKREANWDVTVSKFPQYAFTAIENNARGDKQ
jgi:hypothetical protein